MTATPRPAHMLGRALLLRCPRCGSKGVICGWFGMEDSCPSCGHRFEARPEEGFFLGAFTVNLAVTEGILLLALFAYIFLLAATGGDVPVVPVLAVCFTLAIVLPVLFYPFSRTIWAAIDLALHSEGDRRRSS
jgi:uncharacterized protein (DUF983 family)